MSMARSVPVQKPLTGADQNGLVLVNVRIQQIGNLVQDDKNAANEATSVAQ